MYVLNCSSEVDLDEQKFNNPPREHRPESPTDRLNQSGVNQGRYQPKKPSDDPLVKDETYPPCCA